MGSALFKQAVIEERRFLTANDNEHNAQYKYRENEITTSHYTAWNFIILNLFEQFHRVVNIYFIILLLLQFIPQISSLNPITTLIPILIVLAITAIKDAVDDVYRHKSDKEVNNRKTLKVTNQKFETERWMSLKVGDVVKITNNEHIPADLLLLSSSEDHNLVYIETADLDGETNLKVRQAFPETGKLGDNLSKMSEFHGKISCEAPNNQLHKFEGNLEWDGATHSIDNDKILLRGCNLRNTEWCFGLVIFAGHDTKLMQNAGRRILKRTRIERFMNTLVWWIFLCLFILSALAAILNSVWETSQGNKFQVFLPWDSFAPNPQMSGFLMFFSNLIILNTLVPISLYVTMEFIRLGQSFFINWDRQLYYRKKDLPAIARTTTLNEELGQVEYIFSDKTGTLTQNIMKFDSCSIAGKKYGEPHVDGIRVPGGAGVKPVDFSSNEYHERSFQFYDHRLADDIESGDDNCKQFFRLIAICHTVVTDGNDTDKLVYRAQSPDEAALVSAARNFGFVFKSRTFDTITILEMGKLVKYDVLAVLEFNNVRKRMSVIVRDANGKVMLLSKGADSVIYERLGPATNSKIKEKTTKHLNSFAGTGLRTLCLAMKDLNDGDYKVWNEAYQKAKTSLDDREDKLNAVYEEIERDLRLLGATAIEDKLQDGVPETIANLSKANIKIWVLTGDKQETAINIGYSCNMLTKQMKEVFIISGYSTEEVERELESGINKMQETDRGETNGAFVDSNEADDLKQSKKRTLQMATSSNRIAGQPATAEGTTYGMVVNGHSLVYALENDLRHQFLEMASKCSAVICCRATPLQKAKVVELVKKNKKAITLAIGDGANDVSMIKAAHIGVGISGEEGTQAVLSSDFSFGQFRFLERLLLVHGRWSYMRMSKFLGYFFYKNFAFTLVQFWFGCFNGFTAQSAYDDWFVAVYNIVYTSTPILVLALFDQDVDDETCLRLPKLYSAGQRNELFNKKVLFRSIIRGFLTSVALFFITYGALVDTQGAAGLDMNDHQTMATTIETGTMFVVTLQVALDTSYWTSLSHLFTWGSIAMFFPFTFGLCSDGFFNWLPTQFPFAGSARGAFVNPALWFTVLLLVATCLLPVMAGRLVSYMFWPNTTQTVLHQQAKHREDSTTNGTSSPVVYNKSKL